jgi:hypothetical protein
MCRGKDMDVMVMDVEGTDGRERGDDQVRHFSACLQQFVMCISRTSNANLLCSLWPPRRSSL